MAVVVPANVMVACCYCGRKQAVPPPPTLVSCVGCEKDFRTLVNYANIAPLGGSVKQKKEGAP